MPINYFDTNLISIILLSVLMINIILRKQQRSLSKRIFMALIANTIVVLALEIISWYLDGKPGENIRRLNLILSNLFFFCNVVIPVCWVIYMDYKIYNSNTRIKKRLFYSPLLLANLILLIINTQNHWIFSLSQDNHYVRGPGMGFYTLYQLAILLIPVVFLRKVFITGKKNILSALTVFIILPLAGAFLQYSIPGSLFVWNMTSVGIVAVYIFVELNTLTKDYLTGLYNRKHIEDWINYKMSGSSLANQFSLILIDLDDFKSINDNCGHNEGDQALIIFSNIMSKSIKRSDIAGRYAGDEFIIILEDSDTRSIELVINRIRKSLDEFNRKQIKPYTLDFSAGGTVYSRNQHRNLNSLFEDVDKKMYTDKNNKKCKTN